MTVEELSKIDREVDLGDQVIAYYKQLVKGCREPDHTNLEDLLASLMHWARGYDMDFGCALSRAEFHFDEELAEHQLGEMGYTGWFESARAKVDELKAAQKRDRQARARADRQRELTVAAAEVGIDLYRHQTHDGKHPGHDSSEQRVPERPGPRILQWLRLLTGGR